MQQLWTQEKKKRKETAYAWKAPDTQGTLARYPHLHSQLLHEVWEGMDPGTTPSGHSGALHAAELPKLGPSFPPGTQSLFQAAT